MIRSLVGPLLVASLSTLAPCTTWGAPGDLPSPRVERGDVAERGPASEPVKIRDNLFLLEEAYNQEPGVIQHIQAFALNPRTRAWNYTFTEEWPVPSDRHQLSVTLPLQTARDSSAIALGDVIINYRLQAIGMGGQGPVAFAPRLSLLVPSGDPRTGAGRGVLGLQANLPFSVELGEHFVTHLNAGVTLTPGAKSPGGASGTAVDASAGAALVWLPLEWANLLVEVAWLSTASVADDGAVGRQAVLVLNPGVRFALTFASGLQIVPASRRRSRSLRRASRSRRWRTSRSSTRCGRPEQPGAYSAVLRAAIAAVVLWCLGSPATATLPP